MMVDRSPYHPPVKRSVTISGHQTSISLEPLFWDMLKAASEETGLAVNALVAAIDNERLASPTPSGLAGAIRIWLVERLRAKSAA
ncbi:MAG: ribbon-helix-helix domain-containing protein [Sphingomonadales bacterium]|nr:ribbon-helix-helix domain-containing protein [Sphingomonadales bacterium]